MITLDVWHITFLLLFLFTLIWHIVSASGTVMTIAQLRQENRLMRTYLQQIQSQKVKTNEQSDQPVSE